MPQQLAEQLGVSTMPVRQALMRLEAERLAIRMSNGALLVAPLSVMEATAQVLVAQVRGRME